MRNEHTDETRAPDGRPMALQPKWRRDFPVDVTRSDYVARRDFTKFMVLTSLAFFVGQISIALKTLLGKRRGELPEKEIARVGKLPVGKAVRFEYPGPDDPCVLVHLSKGKFVAFDQRCTHLSCAVEPDVASGRFLCPCHHGIFDLETGRPIAGPPRRPLPEITLRVRGGAVYAVGRKERT